MRLRGTCTALAALLIMAAPGGLAVGAAASPVPPPAPVPTDSGNSPAVPDPHPPLGGRNADGEAVGGPRLLSRGNVLPAGAPALPDDLTAQAWMVTDLDTGKILAARDPHGRYQPASIQKLLTTVALLPLLPGSRTVTVSRKSAETEGSHAGLVAGGKYTIDQIFEGLLLVSGNDCAEALSAAAGGRSQTVALMNRTALDLGAVDTYIQTPSGLDGWQQLTSAYDMTLFLRAALAQPRFLAYDNTAKSVLPRQQINGFGPVELYNQNLEFLTTVKGALAAKTGFTDAAQHTFVGAIKRDGHRYGVVLLRAQRYPDDQWVQAKNLVNWARKLPASAAAVGTLITPTPPAASSSASATPDHGTSGGASSRSITADGGGFPGWLQIVLSVILVGGATLITRRALRTSRSR
ncbi:MAG: hypothetical protein ABI345_16000 [Jatrophihabitans sp.]